MNAQFGMDIPGQLDKMITVSGIFFLYRFLMRLIRK